VHKFAVSEWRGGCNYTLRGSLITRLPRLSIHDRGGVTCKTRIAEMIGKIRQGL